VKIFPNFKEEIVADFAIWRSNFAQPITIPNYSQLLSDLKMPFDNSFLCTMAQIYPEDRGTNYAVRDGKRIAHKIINYLDVKQGIKL
jgi:hypothetical protein